MMGTGISRDAVGTVWSMQLKDSVLSYDLEASTGDGKLLIRNTLILCALRSYWTTVQYQSSLVE